MRPNLKTFAIATFIGGCAAAGIAVASASTPAGTPARPAVPASTSVTSAAERHGGNPTEAVHHHRHGGRAAISTASATVEPGDDNGVRNEPEPGDDRGATSEPGDDNGGAAEPGDDRGDNRGPGDNSGPGSGGSDDNRGPGGGDDNSGPGNGGDDGGHSGSDG
jgi:hypothetical protein